MVPNYNINSHLFSEFDKGRRRQHSKNLIKRSGHDVRSLCSVTELLIAELTNNCVTCTILNNSTYLKWPQITN